MSQHPQSLLLEVGILGLPHHWQICLALQTTLWLLRQKALNTWYLHWDPNLCPISAFPTVNYFPSSETLRSVLLQGVNKMDFIYRCLCSISGLGYKDYQFYSPFQAFKMSDLQCLVCDTNGSDTGTFMILCYWFNTLFLTCSLCWELFALTTWLIFISSWLHRNTQVTETTPKKSGVTFKNIFWKVIISILLAYYCSIIKL